MRVGAEGRGAESRLRLNILCNFKLIKGEARTGRKLSGGPEEVPQIPRLGKGLLAILFAPLAGTSAAFRYGVTRVHICGSHVAARRSDNKTIPRGGGNDSQRPEEIWQRKPDRNVLAASE